MNKKTRPKKKEIIIPKNKKKEEKIIKIKNLLTNINTKLTNDITYSKIILICNILRIKRYEWCSFLELSDDSGSIDGYITKKNINVNFKEDTKIKVFGSIRMNPKFSKIEICINNYELLDSSKTKFELLKEKLENEGILNIPKKVILNKYKNVGVITSLNAAGLKDTINALLQNMKWGNIIIYPTLMQGEKTCPSIIKCINRANIENKCEILLITRGGGSKTDLEWFDNYELAINIIKSNIPIVSGIGHEIDKTIVDIVVDKSFITPTDASNNLTKGFLGYANEIDKLIIDFNNITNNLICKIGSSKNKIEEFEKNIYFSMENQIDNMTNQYNNLINQFSLKYSNMVKHYKTFNPINWLNDLYFKSLYLDNIFNMIENRIADYKMDIIKYKENLENSITPRIISTNNYIQTKKDFLDNIKNKKEIIIKFIDGDIILTKIFKEFKQ